MGGKCSSGETWQITGGQIAGGLGGSPRGLAIKVRFQPRSEGAESLLCRGPAEGVGKNF